MGNQKTQIFNLTPRARDDLQSIWLYSLRTWGETQADTYITQLFNHFAWLSERPLVGKHRPDICERYYCFPQQSHLVFYLITEESIDIIGIHHKEMDILNYFE